MIYIYIYRSWSQRKEDFQSAKSRRSIVNWYVYIISFFSKWFSKVRKNALFSLSPFSASICMGRRRNNWIWSSAGSSLFLLAYNSITQCVITRNARARSREKRRKLTSRLLISSAGSSSVQRQKKRASERAASFLRAHRWRIYILKSKVNTRASKGRSFFFFQNKNGWTAAVAADHIACGEHLERVPGGHNTHTHTASFNCRLFSTGQLYTPSPPWFHLVCVYIYITHFSSSSRK